MKSTLVRNGVRAALTMGAVTSLGTAQVAVVQRRLGNVEVPVDCLAPSLSQLQEYMIVAGRGKNTCFAQPHFRDELKIIGHSPYPPGYLRKLIISLFA